MKTWAREWWVTLRYGSRLTRAGRELRRSLRDGDDLSAFVEVVPPSADIDCRIAGCRWGHPLSPHCECVPAAAR